jgi:DNA repair exonuclease SbcCD nuclease subunit
VQEQKQPHAPFRAEQIERAGFDHALLGHFHTPRDADRYTYPGNPDPLEFGEQGERGVVLVEVGQDGTITRERRSVAITAVHDLTVDIGGCESVDSVQARVADALPTGGGWIRLTLRGEIDKDCAFHPADLDVLLERFDASIVRTGGVRIAYDLDELAQEQGTVRGAFVSSVRDDPSMEDEEKRRVLITGLRALEGRDDLEIF